MNYLLSFLFCGFVCVIAQLIYEYTKLTPGHITCSFVVLGALLDLFHIYDRLIKIFHAGAMLPITSFGHSLLSSIEVLFPKNKLEQQQIASYFINLDKQITLQSQRLEKLKQIKAACLDKMFV